MKRSEIELFHEQLNHNRLKIMERRAALYAKTGRFVEKSRAEHLQRVVQEQLQNARGK